MQFDYEPVDSREVCEALQKLLGDIEHLAKHGESAQEDVLSVLRLDHGRYARALREAIRLFGGGEPRDAGQRIVDGLAG